MKLYVLIKPSSKHREAVITQKDGAIIVFTKAPATEGKANAAAAKLIAKHYDVPKTSVQLVRGHASKYKVFEVLHP